MSLCPLLCFQVEDTEARLIAEMQGQKAHFEEYARVKEGFGIGFRWDA